MTNEWATANTGSYPQSQADFNRMGTLLRNNDPWIANGSSLRPLSIHQNTRIDFQFFGESWPTHAIIQDSPRNQEGYRNGDQWGNSGIVYNLGHNMPVVNDEYAYFGEVNSGRLVTRDIHRNAMWGVAVAGGYGSTADFYENPNGKGIAESTGDWNDRPEYGDIKQMVDFFTTKNIEYWKMASNNALKSSSRSRDYVLAEPGRQYVLYTARGSSSVQLNLSGYGSTTFNVYKYDPTSGAMTSLAPVTGGAWRR